MTITLEEGIEWGVCRPDALTGMSINAETMQSIPAVSQAINTICILASMPLKAYVDDGKTREEADTYLSNILDRDPNDFITAPQFWSAFIRSMYVHGFGVAKITEQENGMIKSLTNWPCSAFTITRDPFTWEPEYRANGIVQDPNDWFYVPLETIDGIFPVVPYQRYRDVLSFAKAIDVYSSSYFLNSCLPSGFLRYPGKLGDDVKAQMKKDWSDKNTGARKAGKVPILEGGLEFQQVQSTPEEAMLKDARQSAIVAVSQLFNISPVFLGNQESLTTSAALVPLFRHLCMVTLLPIARKLEAEIKKKLIKKTDQNLYFEYSFDSLLRGVPADRYASYALALGNQAWLTIDEVRAMEHYGPKPMEEEMPAYDIPQQLGDSAQPDATLPPLPAPTPAPEVNNAK